METKKIFFLFCLLLSMATTKAFAYDIAVKNADSVIIYYNYINNGKELEVTGNSDNTYDDFRQYTVRRSRTSRISNITYIKYVIIPEEVIYMNRVRKVTRIGNRAFENCNSLISVAIPNSVTNIGSRAFSGCSNLTSIEIPNSVTSIGSRAFSGCSNLTSITIPHSVTRIESRVFEDCDRLTSVAIPNSVTSIGEGTFSKCI